MNIANPVYDVVFKYLMKDSKIARLLISAITGLKIKKLDFVTTEKTVTLEDEPLTVYRLDFTASVLDSKGEERRVLIEIQKARLNQDIVRFRRYLGQEYSDKNNLLEKTEGNKTVLIAIPLLTIYFLGYSLNQVREPVIRVTREYINAVTGEKITQRDEFIEGITHDSHIIQIPYLKQEFRTDLLSILSLFDQNLKVKDGHLLDIDEAKYPKKYHHVIRRLQKAVSESKVRNLMDLEDEVVSELQERARTIEKERTAKEKARAAAKKERAEKEKAKATAKKERAAKEKARAAEKKERTAKEEARATAKKERAAKEKARAAEKKERAEKEKERTAKEEARATAKKERAEKEKARATAKKERAEKEEALAKIKELEALLGKKT